jgi:predicted amidohydrolase
MGLLLRGGQVMDPGAGLTGALDVRIRDGLITEVAHGQHITGRQRFVPTLTLRAGEVWWRGGPR